MTSSYTLYILISTINRPASYVYVLVQKNITEYMIYTRRATKLVPSVSILSYETRLNQLQLHSLYCRQQRSNLIEACKIMNNQYLTNVVFTTRVPGGVIHQNYLNQGSTLLFHFILLYTIPLKARPVKAGSQYLHTHLNSYLNAEKSQPRGDLNPRQHAV